MNDGWTLNLFGVLFSRSPERATAEIVNHERIHSRQMREMLWLPFYIAYGLEYLWRLLRSRSRWKAYRTLSFEREAYDHQRDLTYLTRRRPFAHWRGPRK